MIRFIASPTTLSDEKIFKDILESSGRMSQKLPPLASNSFFNSHWIENLKDTIKEGLRWLQGHFFINNTPSPVSLEFLYQIILNFILISAFLFITIGIYLIVKKIRAKQFIEGETLHNWAPSDDAIVGPLLDALREKNLPLAFRLRWKLHLLRKQQPLSKTPWEVYKDTTIPEIAAHLQYVCMFGALPLEESIFKKYDHALELLEQGNKT